MNRQIMLFYCKRRQYREEAVSCQCCVGKAKGWTKVNVAHELDSLRVYHKASSFRLTFGSIQYYCRIMAQ